MDVPVFQKKNMIKPVIYTYKKTISYMVVAIGNST